MGAVRLTRVRISPSPPMKITICGSMAFFREMIAVKEGLEIIGYEPLLPKGIEEEIPIEARSDITEEDKIAAKIEFDFIREHFRKIDEADAILY